MEFLKQPANLKDFKTMSTLAGTALLFIALPLTIFVTLQQRDYRSNAAVVPSGFVTRQGNKLMLNGNEFKFIGVTRDGLANSTFFDSPSGVFKNPVPKTQAEIDSFLDNIFTKLKENNINVVRFWAFQSYVDKDNNGTLDFSQMDKVITKAEANGIKLVPVLENQFHWSTLGGDKGRCWYQDGYKVPYGDLLPDGTPGKQYKFSYPDYLQQIVTRYKDSPAILMWQLVSEAQIISQPTSSCPADLLGRTDAEIFYDFTKNMSEYVKSLDANHLVSMGVSGTGQPGTAGSDYKKLHSIASIDVVGAHDYNYPEEPLPGSSESPRSQAYFELYVTDNSGVWKSIVHRQITLGKWVTLYGKLPSSITTPIPRAAINIKVGGTDSWVGSVYIDDITLGSDSYDFESGTQGWDWDRSGTFISSISKSNDRGYNGSASSLKIDLNGDTTKTGRVHLSPPSVSLGADSTFMIHVYVPSTAPASSKNTMYSDLMDAKTLDKPFFFGEAGIYTLRPNETNPDLLCDNPNYCYSAQDRANLFDAKINAAFANGVSGYIVWYWDNSTALGGKSCSWFGPYCFDENDPLVDVLNGYGAAPTVNIWADSSNIVYNSATTVHWTSTNATSCTVTLGGGSGTSGSFSTGLLTVSTTYTADCSGSGGGIAGTVTINVGSPPSVSGKTGDLNDDNLVNIADFGIFLGKWGTADQKSDLSHDGSVNISDFGIFLGKWGT